MISAIISCGTKCVGVVISFSHVFISIKGLKLQMVLMRIKSDRKKIRILHVIFVARKIMLQIQMIRYTFYNGSIQITVGISYDEVKHVN